MSYEVVGFNGLPVESCASIKAPIVFDNEKQLYSAHWPNDKNWDWKPEWEIIEAKELKLVTLTKIHKPYIDGMVAIYAHNDCVRPSDTRLVTLDVSKLIFEECCESYVAFLHIDEVKSIFNDWVASLLDSVNKFSEYDKDLYEREILRIKNIMSLTR